MYDPRIGRFLQEDPIGFDGGDENLYRYAGNNPTNSTDPSGLLAVPAQPANASFGSNEFRALVGLNPTNDANRVAIFDLTMLAAQSSLSPTTVSAIFLGWDRLINRGFGTVGRFPNDRSTEPVDTAADLAAAEVLRTIDRRLVQLAVAASPARLLMQPIGINTVAAEISRAAAIDAMARQQFARLGSPVHQNREDAEEKLRRLLFAEPALVAQILRQIPTNDPEQLRRRNQQLVDVPAMDVFERNEFQRLHGADIVRKYAEAVLREYLGPLPESEINRILAARPDAASTPNFARLMRLIRGS